MNQIRLVMTAAVIMLNLLFSVSVYSDLDDYDDNVRTAMDAAEHKHFSPGKSSPPRTPENFSLNEVLVPDKVSELAQQNLEETAVPTQPAAPENQPVPEPAPDVPVEENVAQENPPAGEPVPPQPPPIVETQREIPPPVNYPQGPSEVISIAPSHAQRKAQPDILIDSLQLKEIDISDALKLISEKSGMNIIAGRNVTGKVTIYLKKVNLWDALRIILESNDLAYVVEDNIIQIMTSRDYETTYGFKFSKKLVTQIVPLKHTNAVDIIGVLNQMKSVVGKVISDDKSNTLILQDIPDSVDSMVNYLKEVDLPKSSKVFDLSYAKAETISTKVTEALTPAVGSVKFDERTNKVVVIDTLQKIEDISRIIEAFDVKGQQVLIEAKIVQIVLSDAYKMGVDWEAIVEDYHNLDIKGNFDILGANDKRGSIGIGTLSDDDYTAVLQALDTVGLTNILSNPHITALNNQEAKILVGSTEPYVTTTTTTPAAGPTTTAESVNFIEVGVKLYVTPTIHNDGFITMKIKPEVSSVTRNITTSENNTIPVVETSEAETTVMAKEGVTIIIGGLIKDETVNETKKVPLLGDIPFLGVVFSSKDNLKRKTELVIFLTAKIISGDVQMDEESLNE